MKGIKPPHTPKVLLVRSTRSLFARKQPVKLLICRTRAWAFLLVSCATSQQKLSIAQSSCFFKVCVSRICAYSHLKTSLSGRHKHQASRIMMWCVSLTAVSELFPSSTCFFKLVLKYSFRYFFFVPVRYEYIMAARVLDRKRSEKATQQRWTRKLI